MPFGLTKSPVTCRTDPVAGSAQATLSLTQTTLSTTLLIVGGSWQATFSPAQRTPSGVVTGALERENDWLIYLDPIGQPPCFEYPFPFSTHGQGFQLNVTRRGNRLTGTSTYRTCTESFQGTIELTR